MRFREYNTKMLNSEYTANFLYIILFNIVSFYFTFNFALKRNFKYFTIYNNHH